MPLIDVHTHIYPASYIELLKSRTEVPMIRTDPDDPENHRLLILPTEAQNPSTARGRPIGPAYHNPTHILTFMAQHHISHSTLSPANPWLDFLPATAAPSAARAMNADLATLSARDPRHFSYFGVLPLTAGAGACAEEVRRLAGTDGKACKGVIMGTSGLGGGGGGLDDPAMLPLWRALAETKTLVFLHPHYGLPAEVYGPRAAAEYGHVLPLAVGFPVETTVAFARMWLGGVFDAVPALRVLLAHAGGVTTGLVGRLESCVTHDERVGRGWEGRRALREVLRENVWLDAVSYGAVGVRMAVEMVGEGRVLFGTDHPFFPPLDGSAEVWESVESNLRGIREAFGGDGEAREKVLWRNAAELLGIDVEEEED